MENEGMIFLIGAGVVLFYVIMAMIKKEYRRNMILGLVIIQTGLYFLNSLVLEQQPINAVLFVSMLAFLILVPSDAKMRGKSGPLWALLTFVGGTITAIVYYFVSKEQPVETETPKETEEMKE